MVWGICTRSRYSFVWHFIFVGSLLLHSSFAAFRDFVCVPNTQVEDGVQYIAPNLNFTEDGIIRSWKIGVEDKTGQSVYLQLWRWSGSSYTRVNETLYEKITDGEVVEVPVSMPALAGDIVGFYNPRPGGEGLKMRWVSMADHIMYGGTRSGDRQTPKSTIDISTSYMSSPLISVSFEPLASTVSSSSIPSSETGCLNTFKDFQFACGDKMDDNRLYIAPDLMFECDGVITEWKVGLESGGNNQRVLMQVWRPINDHHTHISEVTYTKTNDEVLAQVPASMTVSAGDVVGIYIPDRQLEPLWISTSGFSLYSQGNSAPTVTVSNMAAVQSSPLVTVVFEPFITSSLLSTMTLLSTSMNTVSSIAPTTSSIVTLSTPTVKTTSEDRRVNTVSSITIGESSAVVNRFTPAAPATPATETSDLTIVVVVVVLVLVVILLVAISLVAALVVWKVRKGKYSFSQASYHKEDNNGDGAVSLMYTAAGTTNQGLTIRNNGLTETHVYDYASENVMANGYEKPLFHTTAKAYEEPGISLVPQCDNHYEFMSNINPTSGYSYGYVPGQTLRVQSSMPLCGKEAEGDILSLCSGYDSMSAYEHVQYTEPRNRVEDLYDQLSETKCIEIPPQVIRKSAILGSGAFGEVYKGVWDSPYGPQDVAVKLLQQKSDPSERVKFLREATIMNQFRHPNVVRLIGAVTLSDPAMLILEFLHKGDLESYLHQQRNLKKIEDNFPSTLLSFCRAVADGMKYLSKKGFVHRDLASRNILLDKNLKCKIADFGLSRDLSDDTYYVATGGKIPVRWTAPESLLYKKFSTKSDVWSYGMLLYEIWSLGMVPYNTLPALEVARHIQSKTLVIQAPPPGCPKHMYKLMVDCWNPDHHLRPEFSQICLVLKSPSSDLLDVPRESVSNPSEAFKLGAPLSSANDLYKDLQQTYSQ